MYLWLYIAMSHMGSTLNAVITSLLCRRHSRRHGTCRRRGDRLIVKDGYDDMLEEGTARALDARLLALGVHLAVIEADGARDRRTGSAPIANLTTIHRIPNGRSSAAISSNLGSTEPQRPKAPIARRPCLLQSASLVAPSWSWYVPGRQVMLRT